MKKERKNDREKVQLIIFLKTSTFMTETPRDTCETFLWEYFETPEAQKVQTRSVSGDFSPKGQRDLFSPEEQTPELSITVLTFTPES